MFSCANTAWSHTECFVVGTFANVMTVARVGLVLCEMIEEGKLQAVIATLWGLRPPACAPWRTPPQRLVHKAYACLILDPMFIRRWILAAALGLEVQAAARAT